MLQRQRPPPASVDDDEEEEEEQEDERGSSPLRPAFGAPEYVIASPSGGVFSNPPPDFYMAPGEVASPPLPALGQPAAPAMGISLAIPQDLEPVEYTSLPVGPAADVTYPPVNPELLHEPTAVGYVRPRQAQGDSAKGVPSAPSATTTSSTSPRRRVVHRKKRKKRHRKKKRLRSITAASLGLPPLPPLAVAVAVSPVKKKKSESHSHTATIRTDEDAREFFASQCRNTFSVLRIKGPSGARSCELTTSGWKYICGCFTSHLTELHVTNCVPISPDVARLICASLRLRCPSLNLLDLWHNGIEDQAARVVAGVVLEGIRVMEKWGLRKVNLGDNEIGAQTLGYLKKVSKGSQVLFDVW